MATQFLHLLMTRIGVGIGEAGSSPASHSIISDYFEKEERATALSIFALGVPIGTSLAYFFGSWLLESMSWRHVFLAVGLPGIALAILVFLSVHEPSHKSEEMSDPDQSAFDLIRQLLSIPTYRSLVAAMTLISFFMYAQSTWIFDFYSRSHTEFASGRILFWLGVISGSAYLFGTLIGGMSVDRWSINRPQMYGYIPAMLLSLVAPAFVAAIWAESVSFSLALVFVMQFAAGSCLGPSFALAQSLAPAGARALSAAVFLLIVNFIALGFGPTFVGVLSSALTPDHGEARALEIALSVSSIAAVVSAFSFSQTGSRLKIDWSKAR
jgi:predicted MFS family arabinose efflux permease